MKRLMTLVLAGVLAIGTSPLASAWGRTGHDAVAYIAEQNISSHTRKVLSRYLDGKSIVYWSSWLDEVRLYPEYIHMRKWHSYAVDENGEPTMGTNVAPEKYRGDAVLELTKLVDQLSDWRHLDDSTVAVGIKLVVHLVGDMHCPGHVIYPGQKGFSVNHSGVQMTYHYLWDESVLEKVHRWGFMEYGHELGNLSRKEAKAIAAGTPVDWGRDNAESCRIIYEWAHPDDEIGYAFRNTAKPLVDMQIQKAGYRLAALLDQIFR